MRSQELIPSFWLSKFLTVAGLFLAIAPSAFGNTSLCAALFNKQRIVVDGSPEAVAERRRVARLRWEEEIAQIPSAKITDFDVASLKDYKRGDGSSNFRTATWNVLNFLEYSGEFRRVKGSNIEEIMPNLPKQSARIAKAVQTFERLDADIVAVQEVEIPTGAVSSKVAADYEVNIRNFSRQFLGDKYEVFVFRGNDRRIMNGFLVKKGFAKHFSIKMVSHADKKWIDSAAGAPVERLLMSRDLAILELRLKKNKLGVPTPDSAPPDAVLLNNHLKSKRDREGDPNSNLWRKAQADYVAEVVKEYYRSMGVNARILEMGDHNGEFWPIRNSPTDAQPVVPAEPEFQAYQTMGLTNTLDHREILPNGKDPRVTIETRRQTHAYFPPKAEPHYGHMDGILASSAALAAHRGSQVLVFLRADGSPAFLMPAYFNQREKQPSDHRPVYSDFDILSFFGLE